MTRLRGIIFYGIIIFLLCTDASAAWKSVVVPAGGAIQDTVFSRAEQGLIYIRTDMGGAYRKDNNNSEWIPLTDWIDDWNLYGVESIAPDPVNANIVYAALGQTYAGTNGALIASNDRGNTWEQYPLPFMCGANNSGNYAGERLAIDPNLRTTLYFGSRLNGLWKSTDSGAAWSQVASFPVNGDSGNGLSYVIFDKNSGTTGNPTQTIYVGVQAVGSGNSNLYRSTNGGTTWSLISGGPSGMSTPQASLGTDGNLWLVYNNANVGPTTGQIWKLNTNTLVWNNISPAAGPGAGAGGYAGISVDDRNAQHAVVSTTGWWGGTDKCFQTTNGGTAWTIIANTQNSWNSGPYPNYNINGATWTRFCSIYDGGAWLISCVQIDPFNSNNAVYSTGGGIWTTTNVLAASQPQGITWTFTDYGIEQTAVIFLLPSYKGGVFFSCLGDISGMRYTNLDAPAPNKYCSPHVGNNLCLDFAENNVNVVARVGQSGAVASDTAFSSDNGQNWAAGSTAPPGYSTSNQMRSCAVAANGSRVLVCPNAGYGNPAYTTNSGSSWTTCNGLPSGSDLASDRVNSSVFFATNGNNLYLSTDGGANFSVVNNFSGNGAPRPVFGLTGEVWVATGNGLYRFTNNGSTKTTISNVPGANSVGFGKAASGKSHPAVYLSGTVGGQRGFFRCDDGVGTSWLRINDNAHQYGYAGWCGGDQEVYGRMYIGTNGRGTLYCDSAAGTATPTITGTPPSATLTPTITRTHTITPTYTVTPMQCNDFLYSGEAPKNLASGGSYIGTSGTVNEVTAQYYSVSHSMQVHFLWPDGWYQGMAFNWSNWNASGTYNASSATALSMWLKSETGTINTLAISLGDSAGGGSNAVQVTAYLAGGVTTTWQELRIPLSAFTGADMSLLWELRITTGGSQAGDQIFYLDDLSFVNACGTPSFTATASSSPTFTRTSTLTATSTTTVTNTCTATPSLTGTRTSTLTVVDTVTFTATPPATATMSVPSPSFTQTASLTSTRTYSVTYTPTATDTHTSASTFTHTVTRTLTGTATATQTDSPDYSPTRTSTGTPPTSTNTPTITATSINTATMTATNTYTRTNTATNTNTVTSTVINTYTRTVTTTGTPANTATRTPVSSATNTPVSTFTNTTLPTSTRTFTRTVTPSFTGTLTITPSFTRTVTPTASRTVTVSFTNTPEPNTPTSTPTIVIADKFEIKDVVLIPNPYNPAHGNFSASINLTSPASGLTVSIYTVSFRLIMKKSMSVSAYGIYTLSLTADKFTGLSNGTYYVVISGITSGGTRAASKPAVLIILK
ncbi:MAG: hypothetical protein LLG37_03930 [Spirochaetia bacterium]|nr:hypothetical protein [Spirochaetia bacterium]